MNQDKLKELSNLLSEEILDMFYDNFLSKVQDYSKVWKDDACQDGDAYFAIEQQALELFANKLLTLKGN